MDFFLNEPRQRSYFNNIFLSLIILCLAVLFFDCVTVLNTREIKRLCYRKKKQREMKWQTLQSLYSKRKTKLHVLRCNRALHSCCHHSKEDIGKEGSGIDGHFRKRRSNQHLLPLVVQSLYDLGGCLVRRNTKWLLCVEHCREKTMKIYSILLKTTEEKKTWCDGTHMTRRTWRESSRRPRSWWRCGWWCWQICRIPPPQLSGSRKTLERHVWRLHLEQFKPLIVFVSVKT